MEITKKPANFKYHIILDEKELEELERVCIEAGRFGFFINRRDEEMYRISEKFKHKIKEIREE